MKLSELDYHLPPQRIAQRPLEERGASRMLVLNREKDGWEDRLFRELPGIVRGDELMVVNDARVLPARLLGRRVGARAEPPGRSSRSRKRFLQSSIEALLVREIEPLTWEALVRPGRKVRLRERLLFGENELEAEVVGRGEFGLRRLRFFCVGDFQAVVERLGHVPLPPYIKRPDEPQDRSRYQTIFARRGRAVAAPTAGLHFTPEILVALQRRGAEIATLTLEIGLGTFEPIRVERLEDHVMHVETYHIPPETVAAIERACREARPVLAVGTTVVRALEDAAAKSSTRGGRLIEAGPAKADIFIYPGWKFRVVDQLLTNFHLPRSSLLALVAAFAGREKILRAYRHAVAEGYRFYSYGDCMLVR